MYFQTRMAAKNAELWSFVCNKRDCGCWVVGWDFSDVGHNSSFVWPFLSESRKFVHLSFLIFFLLLFLSVFPTFAQRVARCHLFIKKTWFVLIESFLLLGGRGCLSKSLLDFGTIDIVFPFYWRHAVKKEKMHSMSKKIDCQNVLLPKSKCAQTPRLARFCWNFWILSMSETSREICWSWKTFFWVQFNPV